MPTSQPKRPSSAVETSREEQRVAHLVLGAPRPAPAIPARPKGISRQEWRFEKARLREAGGQLAPGIEERVQLRERWSHKAQGTPETHEHVAASTSRAGAIARLHASGTLDVHQLAASAEIVEAHERLVADVTLRTAKLEPRGTGGGPDAAATEALRSIVLDRAYSDWRAAIGPLAAMLLAIIVDDMPLTEAARRWRMSNRRARTTLVLALDRWRRRP